MLKAIYPDSHTRKEASWKKPLQILKPVSDRTDPNGINKNESMSIFMVIFYLIGAVMVISTLLAITRKNIVHTVLYLVLSFLGSALLFFLLGAPFLAAMEVLIYAGAIMVLFLFIVMMLTVKKPEKLNLSGGNLFGMMVMLVLYLLSLILLYVNSPFGFDRPMSLGTVSPRDFGIALFSDHWLSIELISLLLLIVLVGALVMGKDKLRRFNQKGGSA